MKYFVNTFLLFLFIVSYLPAQTVKHHTKSKKAVELYETAFLALNEQRIEDALVLLTQSLSKDPAFLEALALRGDVYGELKQYDKAIADKETVLKINTEEFNFLNLDLGGLYFALQQYDKAETVLKIYLEKSKIKPYPESIKKAEKILANCAFSREAVKHPVSFTPMNMGKAINSIYKDYNPFVSVDGETFIVTRTIPDERSAIKMQEDFFISEKIGKEWAQAVNMGTPINSVVNEGALTLSPDGRTMVFTICEVMGDFGEGRQGMGSCDLFVSQKIGNNRWSKPKNLGPQINSTKHDAQPCISSDGKAIYYSSARAGGQGKSDLYVVYVGEKGFSKPENLGAKINTSEMEDGVFIHPDNQTLYFSSDGHTGMGGRDLYMSRREKDGTWGTPINLGYPINTSGDERTLFVDAKGDLAYFASDREGGVGELDIYSFQLPVSVKPIPVTYMKGIVYDKATKSPVGGATFELIDLESGKQVIESWSDAKDGSFLVCLPTGKNYALNVKAEGGYLFFSENFELNDLKKGENAYEKDVPLSKISVGEKVVLKNVFFETDSYELKPESKVELNKLVEFLQKNQTLKIELGGHTDNQGAKAHNQTLSQNRANAVKDYLIQQGIEASRLSAKGYANDVPVDTNDTEIGRANNRRTEFKVL